ncbi:hypothetical protein BH23CHL7_BH23CHL7_06030 [soil metagenome]
MAADRTRAEIMAERQRAAEVLDAQDDSGPVPLLTPAEALDALERARRIGIVGASPDPGRAAHAAMRYLMQQGYDCVPINPNTREVLAVPAWRTIEEAVAETGPFDVIDVFRRAEHTPAIARSAVAVGARVLWLQLGVVNWEAARIAHAGGLAVVMDRCTTMDHRRLRERRRGQPR